MQQVSVLGDLSQMTTHNLQGRIPTLVSRGFTWSLLAQSYSWPELSFDLFLWRKPPNLPIWCWIPMTRSSVLNVTLQSLLILRLATKANSCNFPSPEPHFLTKDFNQKHNAVNYIFFQQFSFQPCFTNQLLCLRLMFCLRCWMNIGNLKRNTQKSKQGKKREPRVYWRLGINWLCHENRK